MESNKNLINTLFSPENFNIYLIGAIGITVGINYCITKYISSGNKKELEEVKEANRNLRTEIRELRAANNDNIIGNNDTVVSNNDTVVSNNDTIVSNNDTVVSNNDTVVSNNDTVVSNNDAIVSSNDTMVTNNDAVVTNNDTIISNPVTESGTIIRNLIDTNVGTTNDLKIFTEMIKLFYRICDSTLGGATKFQVESVITNSFSNFSNFRFVFHHLNSLLNPVAEGIHNLIILNNAVGYGLYSIYLTVILTCAGCMLAHKVIAGILVPSRRKVDPEDLSEKDYMFIKIIQEKIYEAYKVLLDIFK